MQFAGQVDAAGISFHAHLIRHAPRAACAAPSPCHHDDHAVTSAVSPTLTTCIAAERSCGSAALHL